ncbi:uncharacterized protein LOC5511609 isoform X2 [Nematostella vectensis]|uniref:uncharacterized protein LOC5511609 isoform X2 n=1 Tax=Nematostella vectensis TaxID=45351 RepID=UPI0020773507|nr:uncharacterized protein LOC5511609 isoform X2 [Nematostella vectensis]
MKKKKTFLLLIFAILLLLVKSQVFEDAVRNADCPTEPIIVHILSLPPYAWQVNNTHSAGIAFTFIRRGLEKCFSHCNASQPKYVFVNSTDELCAVLLQNATDIALPITSALENELDDGDDPTFDYYQKHPHLVFDSLVNSPGLSYVIHLGNTNDVVKNHMINALVEVWPVVIYCILLAGISGILVWVMEFKLNRSEFPKNFFHGSFEGFWWAFVSMTTVGYGDKTPKSVWGRLFGVAWILIGLVIIATFTAAATSALDSGMTYYKSGVDGKTVGVLEGTEAGVEALRKGATVKSYSTFRLMHEDLKHAKLDGLLLDRYEASHVMNTWQDDELRVLDTIDITIRYKLARILGRNSALGRNTCLRDRLSRHDTLVNKMVRDHIKPVKTFNMAEHSLGLFSSESPSTLAAVGVLLGVLGAMVVLGTLYQCLYRKIPLGRRKSYTPRDDSIYRMQAAVLVELHNSVRVLSDEILAIQRTLDRLKVTPSGHVNIFVSDKGNIDHQ